ncbi:putative disco-interacting protein 2 -like C-like, partial [Scophthalmus maximus]
MINHITSVSQNHSAPPDVTGYTNNTAGGADGIQVERAPGAAVQRQTPKYGNAELMETGDGECNFICSMIKPWNSKRRVHRVPLPFSPGLAPVQQPDPNQPKAEGAQMVAMRGEQLGVVTNWPPSLEAALQRWGTISPKAPCLTTMDTNGKPLYVLTYGKLWSRSVKVAYNLLHKLGSKQEPLVRPGDRVRNTQTHRLHGPRRMDMEILPERPTVVLTLSSASYGIEVDVEISTDGGFITRGRQRSIQLRCSIRLGVGRERTLFERFTCITINISRLNMLAKRGKSQPMLNLTKQHHSEQAIYLFISFVHSDLSRSVCVCACVCVCVCVFVCVRENKKVLVFIFFNICNLGSTDPLTAVGKWRSPAPELYFLCSLFFLKTSQSSW